MKNYSIKIIHKSTNIVKFSAAIRELSNMLETSSLQIEMHKMSERIGKDANSIISIVEDLEEELERRGL